jgi:hypothetical protein
MSSRGGSKPYELGREYERRAREALEGMGYFVVRSAMSKGPIDLVAIPMGPVARETSGLVRLVQVKYGSAPRPGVRRELANFAAKLDNPRVLVELWSYVPWQTKPFLESVGPAKLEKPSRAFVPRAPRSPAREENGRAPCSTPKP